MDILTFLVAYADICLCVYPFPHLTRCELHVTFATLYPPGLYVHGARAPEENANFANSPGRQTGQTQETRNPALGGHGFFRAKTPVDRSRRRAGAPAPRARE